MPVKITPLTKQQLLVCFKVYREAFPDWLVEYDTVLARVKGAVKQRISFEPLRDGAYRPSCSVEVLITPGVRILHRFLDIKHREVLLRDHPMKWSLMLKAMEEQFQPSVRAALDTLEVLRLGEEDVVRNKISNINYFSGLAAMNAYVGNAVRGSFWCNRVDEYLKNLGRNPLDWELSQAQFVRQLRNAIEEGHAQAFLDMIMRQRSEV